MGESVDGLILISIASSYSPNNKLVGFKAGPRCLMRFSVSGLTFMYNTVHKLDDSSVRASVSFSEATCFSNGPRS